LENTNTKIKEKEEEIEKAKKDDKKIET